MSAPAAAEVVLSDVQLARLADLIAVRLRVPVEAASDARLVSAGEVAARLGLDSKTVYRHAVALGGVKVGRAWRFDLDRALAAWRSGAGDRSGSERPQPSVAPAGTGATGRRRRPPSGSHCQLLPVGRVQATGSEAA